MTSSVDLFWLPLGAGGRVVRWNGRAYERIQARRRRDRPRELFHAALELTEDGRSSVIEMAPVWSESSPGRGVVVEGPVGLRLLGKVRAFRYEVRCWPDGCIPDRGEAVDSPVRVSSDPGRVADVRALVARCPTFTWGRDALGCGDMWNSNSLVAWLLASTGDVAGLVPPHEGRAPGWLSGVVLAESSGSAGRLAARGHL
jgi:hypothetical protein